VSRFPHSRFRSHRESLFSFVVGVVS
jgi:hypothetical protein